MVKIEIEQEQFNEKEIEERECGKISDRMLR